MRGNAAPKSAMNGNQKELSVKEKARVWWQGLEPTFDMMG